MRLEYFSMIDRLVSFDIEAGTIVCQSDVPLQSPVFEGHFPGFPLLPGVLQTEVMAQVSAHISLKKVDFRRMAVLASIRSSKYRGFVHPGDRLTILSELVHLGDDYTVCHASLKKEDLLVANAEVRLKLIEFPNDKVKEAIKTSANLLDGTLRAA